MGTCKATAKHGPGYDWEALRAHLREADLEDYITKVSGTVFHGPESNRRGKCPLHNGNNNTSFKVSCHDGVWRYRCFSQCGSGDIIDFAEKFQGYSRKDAPLLVAKALGIDPQRGTASYKQPAKKPARAIIEPAKPVIDWELRDGITPTTVQEMKASSPVPLDQHPRELIEELFGPDDLVCAGRDVRHSLIRKTPEWRNCIAMDTWQFICPNPMKSLDGRRQRLNVDRRDYFVVDIDEFSAESFVTPLDQCMTVINELALNMHLTMVVATGGKGAHGWFYIGHRPDNLESWMGHAGLLGADPAMLTLNQWARLPNGTRENGNRQSLLYLNPTKPI